MNLVSSGSTLRGWFSGYSLVRLSQTAVVAVLHCKLTNRLVVKTCTVKMNNEARSTLPGPWAPLGRRGELSVAGQVAMATGRDGRRTMPSGGAGSPIGGRPSGTRVEDATGGVDGCARCTGRLRGLAKRASGEPMVRRCLV